MSIRKRSRKESSNKKNGNVKPAGQRAAMWAKN